MAPRHSTCTRAGRRHGKLRRRYVVVPLDNDDDGAGTAAAVAVLLLLEVAVTAPAERNGRSSTASLSARRTALAMVPPSPKELTVPADRRVGREG